MIQKKYFQISEETIKLVRGWFLPDSLMQFCGRGTSLTEQAGKEWLAMDGKRWRPLLTVLISKVLSDLPVERIAPIAVGVECFHKASLVHDDIEDADVERYGHPTVHAQYGIPLAINIGDWLIGEGYRLLDDPSFPADVRAELVRVASIGHRKLCLGQGNELQASAALSPLSLKEVLQMYERKTSSAFEVAVLAGAIVAEADSSTQNLLSEFARLIGIAYQIQDDREDFYAIRGRTSDLLSLRPTIYLAEALVNPFIQPLVERACGEPSQENKKRLMDAILSSDVPDHVSLRLQQLLSQLEKLAAQAKPASLAALLQGIISLAVHRK